VPVELTPLRRNRLILIGLWFLLYCGYTLFTPPLLDDADSVHSEVAREMIARHDWVTLYANGIRYLEKAPLLYWSMAASMSVFAPTAAAARLPLAFTVLALMLALEGFARRALADEDSTDDGVRVGFYAGLVVLLNFGIFIFTRITIPDVMVCLWLALAVFCFWETERPVAPIQSAPFLPPRIPLPAKRPCFGFAACCALGVLTKGLIGLVFPLGVVVVYLLLARGVRGAIMRLLQLHPVTSAAIFFLIAAPWHVLIGLANPSQGDPGSVHFSHGHWIVPQPTDGNVHGWTWFYFVNEHLLRYLNLRVPRDYDTVPLLLFWGLVLVWLMPWSAFVFKALGQIEARAALVASPLFARWRWLQQKLNPAGDAVSVTQREKTMLLLGVWAALPLVFFSLSTRQEYYVLPSLPALALLIAAWLDREAAEAESYSVPNVTTTAGQRIARVMLMIGSVAALVAVFFVVRAEAPDPNFDLARMLQQNPSEYALSFGHFLDLNAKAMGAFRDPLIVTALALFGSTLASWLLRNNFRPHAANCWLAAGAFWFLIAAHMGLQIFAPVLSSKKLADSVAPELKRSDVIVIHGEYEAGSTLGFYLQRNDIHILDGRSSNLWYGSFFPDAPAIFEDANTIKQRWSGVQRVYMWQDLSQPLPKLTGKVYVLAESGGKEIISNQPDKY